MTFSKLFIKLFTLLTLGWVALFANSLLASDSKASGFESVQESLYKLFDQKNQTVVKVYAQKEVVNSKGVKSEILEAGSGFFISAYGHVMTTAYITYAGKKIWIEWNGVLFDAECVGYDPLTTISILKASSDSSLKKVPFVDIDSKAELPRIATLLTSLSFELGMPVSPRMGMALGSNTEFGGVFLPTVYVRTNIPAIQGAIGSPVFDLSGKFAGMVVAAIPETRGSFIIPARAAAKIKDDILLCGEPIYSWIGLQAGTALQSGSKLLISLVVENAPARKAGFMVGDEILEVNGKKVLNNAQLRELTFFIRPNEVATFKVRRGEKILKIEVPAERMSSDIVKTAQAKFAPRATPKASTLNDKDKTQTSSQKNY